MASISTHSPRPVSSGAGGGVADAPATVARKQALRMKRFLMACVTYALGFAILVLCHVLGLLSPGRLALIGAAFLMVSMVVFVLIRSGWNLRWKDPSLTRLQVYLSASLVCLILVVGERIQSLAVPFYGALFVFAMLQLNRRALLWFELYVLASYACSVVVRAALSTTGLDLQVEAVSAVMLAVCSLWYCLAAAYISALRGRLRESLNTIEQLAMRDALTDTWNRRHLDAQLLSEMLRCSRLGGSLCIGLVDIDHFKSINDRHGHLAGDTVLRRVADCMKAQLRATDELGRFGGEEFLLLLPGTALAQAQVCAERVRAGVAELPALPDTDTRVTVSIGVAQFAADELPAALLERVDRAMYEAKNGGRNRVVVDRTVGSDSSPAPRRDAASSRGAGAKPHAPAAFVLGRQGR